MNLRRLKEILPDLRRLVPDIDIRDVLVFGGIAAAGYGVGMIYPPAAWIFCGLALFWLGVK
jgi:hypothetical protein